MAMIQYTRLRHKLFFDIENAMKLKLQFYTAVNANASTTDVAFYTRIEIENILLKGKING